VSETHHQIRINELARELEVKAKVIVELLPEVGLTEKKTHSSSIDEAIAEKVRQHFRKASQAEQESERSVVEARKAPTEMPSAPIATQAPPPPAPPPAVRETAPPVSAAEAPVHAPAPSGAAVRPPSVPVSPAALPAPVSAAPRPAAGVAPGQPPKTGVPPATPPAPKPGTQPLVSRPGAPVQRPMHPTSTYAPGKPPFIPQRPTGPGMRPGAPGARPPQLSGRPAPTGPRPSGPGRPGEPSRPGMRPGGRGVRPPTGRTPGNLPPKPEPGKPIYVRKPEQRTRPLVDKRFEEGERKLHPVRTRVPETARRTAPAERPPVLREHRDITITEGVTVRELAQKLDLRAKDLLKELVEGGIFATINQVMDVPTATKLAAQFNATVTAIPFEEQLVEEEVQESRPEDLKPRAPVVTVMGHVDHGKTSLLDTIRQTKVAAGEAGGITQHIGAYHVQLDGKRVVFIDTPGHEAFTRMRARGAGVTDIVVLVVAADDGVMPQTREAIDHARAAKVPIVVAVNKIDKPDAQPERVKRQLSDVGLMPEEWGGDTVFVEVSAKTGQNVDKLLEMIALVGELRELKANPDASASGVVLESRIDKGRGPVATLLVRNGTLHVGDSFICGAVYGKVRAMYDDHGQPVKRAEPSTPVEILGLQGVPEAGDRLLVADEAKARHISDYRLANLREASLARTAGARLTLDQLQEQLRAGEIKELPIVIKADVQGSVEVLAEMLPKLSTDKVKLDIIHSSVGAVSESDVLLGTASKAVIVAFNVRPDRKAVELAQRENVEIRSYTVIYELIDDMKKLMTGLLEPVFKETVLGRAEVRDTFRVKGVGMIAGCRVLDGLVRRDADVRVVRDGAVIYSGKVQSLRRFKEDVTEVRGGFECGAGISNFNDVKVGDVLECFTVEKIIAAQATA